MRLLKTILFSLLPFLLLAQEEGIEYPITANTVFKDVNENVISFETFLEWTSGQTYQIEPIFDEEGNIKVIYVVAPSVSQNYSTNTTRFVRSAKQSRFDAPAFSIADINNKHYTLSALQSKVIVLKFWFINCKPCIAEIPELNHLVDDFKSEEVVFLAPALDKATSLQEFLQQKAFHYNIIPNARKMAHDYNVFGYPTHMVINPQGEVSAIYVGINSNIRELLKDAIEEALHGIKEKVVTESIPVVSNTPQKSEKELNTVKTTDVIKDESGNSINFGQFLEMANSGQFKPVRRFDDAGAPYVLMKKKKQK